VFAHLNLNRGLAPNVASGFMALETTDSEAVAAVGRERVLGGEGVLVGKPAGHGATAGPRPLRR
jgi:hypothetical protein